MANWWRYIAELGATALNHERRLVTLEKKEKHIMAQLDDVKAEIQGLVAEDSIVIAALNDLKTKVDAGGTVTSEDLNDLQSAIHAEVGRLHDAVNATDPAADPANTPGPGTVTPGGGDVPVEPVSDPPVETGNENNPINS